VPPLPPWVAGGRVRRTGNGTGATVMTIPMVLGLIVVAAMVVTVALGAVMARIAWEADEMGEGRGWD
jgi:hypothetical protein